MAPVRISVKDVALMMASGAPVNGSNNVSKPISEGSPALKLLTKSPTTLTPASPSGCTTPRKTLKCPSPESRGTKCTRGSMTTAPLPCASSAASTASRIASSVSASRSTSGPLRYVRWICGNLACLLNEPKAPQVMFRIDQYCRHHSERGDQSSGDQVARPKSNAWICIDVDDTAHRNGSAQARERHNRVRDAERRAALRRRGDFADQCGAQREDDAADRTRQA